MTIPTWEELTQQLDPFGEPLDDHQTPPQDHESDDNEPPGPQDPDEMTPAELIKSRLITTAELRHIPRPKPLLDGLLYLDSLAMLYGPSGGGKSFVAVDIAMTVGEKRAGELNGMAKLTDAQVKEIRLLLSNQKFLISFPSTHAMYEKLAETYKVHFATIRSIARFESWKHIKV